MRNLSELSLFIIQSGLGLALGVGLGEFFSFRRRGRKIVVEVEAKEIWESIVRRVAWIVVIVVFLASLAQSVIFTYTQRQCNLAVVENLRFRGTITTELQQISDARDAALNELFATVLTAASTPDPSATVRLALEKQAKTTADLNAEAEKRKQARNDAPLPDCS